MIVYRSLRLFILEIGFRFLPESDC